MNEYKVKLEQMVHLYGKMIELIKEIDNSEDLDQALSYLENDIQNDKDYLKEMSHSANAEACQYAKMELDYLNQSEINDPCLTGEFALDEATYVMKEAFLIALKNMKKEVIKNGE